MAQAIIELTEITPSASNYELHYKKLEGNHLFSLRAKGKNGEPYFTFKPLSAISINSVVFETPEELIEAFHENFNSPNSGATLTQIPDLETEEGEEGQLAQLPDGSVVVWFDGAWVAVGADPIYHTLYIHSTTGNNATAKIGDKNFPFQTTAGAIAALPADNGETYTLFYLDNVSHSVTVQLPPRNLIFKSFVFGNGGFTLFMGATESTALNFSTLGGTNIINTTLSEYIRPKYTYTFDTIQIINTSIATALRFNDANCFIKFNNVLIDFRNQVNSVFNVASVEGSIDRIVFGGTACTLFMAQAYDSIKNIDIKQIHINGTGYYWLFSSSAYVFCNIALISGTAGSSDRGLYISTGCSLCSFSFMHMTVNGNVFLSSQGDQNNVFQFLKTILTSVVKLDAGTSGGGLITGTLDESNTVGMRAFYQDYGTYHFKDFRGKLDFIDRYAAGVIFIFENCNIDTVGSLFTIYTTPTNDTIRFWGKNTIRQTTPSALIANNSSTYTIQKRGVINTNATSLASNGTVTINDVTPNTY